MLGGVNAKKGTVLNDIGWRKRQEGKDFQAIFPEVEWPKRQEGKDFWGQSPDPPDWSHRPPDKPGLTAHAFRMTLVAQGKLPQITK